MIPRSDRCDLALICHENSSRKRFILRFNGALVLRMATIIAQNARIKQVGREMILTFCRGTQKWTMWSDVVRFHCVSSTERLRHADACPAYIAPSRKLNEHNEPEATEAFVSSRRPPPLLSPPSSQFSSLNFYCYADGWIIYCLHVAHWLDRIMFSFSSVETNINYEFQPLSDF